MRNAMIALATLLVGVSLGLPSFAAAWATPGAACTQEGANANSDGFLTCTGGVWVSNAVLMGTISATCDSTKAGYIRYTGGKFEGCNGTGWIQLASSSKLRVYKADGVTVLGNYLGSLGTNTETNAPCAYTMYADETTGAIVALDYYDCSATTPSQNVWFSATNCTGTAWIYSDGGSSRVLVELGKIHQHSLLKVGKVAKTVSHAFHCFYRVVNSLNNTRRDAMGKIV